MAAATSSIMLSTEKALLPWPTERQKPTGTPVSCRT